MKTVLVAILVLSLMGLPLVAQEHSQEKKASDDITVTAPLMMGGKVLEPGKYRVACDKTDVTFTRLSDNEKVLTLPCKGKDLGKKAENTEIHTSLNPQNTRVVDKLLIRGSIVEHVF